MAGLAETEREPELEAVELPEPAPEPEPELPPEPDAEREAADDEAVEPSAPAAGFTPPPSSLEDLAAASRPTRFSIRSRFGDK
jgi:hypothetical protein